ncbi:MAG TPA: ComF family protein [Saprospiraceae bacterium]|nr:ComF family protein [Saprospiraceae bacterium]HRG64242.1 ComF family protein [Saprospiraceae bacterium]
MLKQIWQAVRGWYDLLYPQLCLCCLEEQKAGKETVFCVKCHSTFPFTNHFQLEDNGLMQHFYGRVKVERAAALMHFSEGGIVQQMLHNLKYRGMYQIGTNLGQMAGERMLESGFSKGMDAVIAVPMHAAKQQQRGYNQSEVIAEKLAESINVPLLKDRLVKIKTTTTQTKKGRLERLENIKDSFVWKNNGQHQPNHLLLVDDVATTGATLEACIVALQSAGINKISVFTIAMAE